MSTTSTDLINEKVDGRSTRYPSALDRIVAKTRFDEDGCFVWTGYRENGGYGRIGVNRRNPVVHRVVWEETVGPIPDGLTLDHLCKNRACVNTDHMEIVTRGENSVRGDGPAGMNARKTHCIHGHEFTPENTYEIPSGGRACMECRRAAARRTYWSNK